MKQNRLGTIMVPKKPRALKTKVLRIIVRRLFHTKLDLWSMSPADFTSTFKFTGFPIIPAAETEENPFLEFNKKQEV